MKRDQSNIDKDLAQVLNKLTDEEEIDVLVYPKQMGEDFRRFLVTKKNEGVLNYNLLQIANCVVVKARKNLILEIAARNDVSRITINPRFTVH